MNIYTCQSVRVTVSSVAIFLCVAYTFLTPILAWGQFTESIRNKPIEYGDFLQDATQYKPHKTRPVGFYGKKKFDIENYKPYEFITYRTPSELKRARYTKIFGEKFNQNELIFYVEVIPLYKKVIPGVPFVFKVRCIVLRDYYIEGQAAGCAPINIFASHSPVFWSYKNFLNEQIVERQDIVLFYQSLYYDKYNLKKMPNVFSCDMVKAGTVYDAYFAVPVPASKESQKIYMTFYHHFRELTICLEWDNELESDFVGDKPECTLPYEEFQNLLLYGAKHFDFRYVPLGEFGLENQLNSEEIKGFEKALTKKDPYAMLLYMQFCYNQHDNWYNIKRHYKPPVSQEEFETWKLGAPYPVMTLFCKLRYDVLFRIMNPAIFYPYDHKGVSYDCYNIQKSYSLDFESNLQFIQKNGYLKLDELNVKTNVPTPNPLESKYKYK